MSDETARVLAEFEESLFPAVVELASLGEAGRPALPRLIETLKSPGWERVGGSEWEDAALLEHGWAYFLSQASEAQIRDAMAWPNSRAVVEVCRELWRRGEPVALLAPHLLGVIGGMWGRSAGQLLREMGEEIAPFDEELFDALRAGHVGAARALGERHPRRVVEAAMGLPCASQDAFVSRRKSVEALLEAGDEAVPEMLARLLDPPGAPRYQCELALLSIPSEELAARRPPGMMVPPDIVPGLARHLFCDQPESLLRWAMTTDETRFRDLARWFRAKGPVVVSDAAANREKAFALAIGPNSVPSEALRAGLTHTDPLVVWCYLGVAERAAVEERPELLAVLEPLCMGQEQSSAIWAMELLARWGHGIEPLKSELTRSLQNTDSRLLALRSLTRRWFEIRMRIRQVASKMAFDLLERELEAKDPQAAFLRAGIDFLEVTRAHNHPLYARLLEWREPAASEPTAEQRLASLEARLDSEMRAPRASLLSFHFQGVDGTPQAITWQVEVPCDASLGSPYADDTEGSPFPFARPGTYESKTMAVAAGHWEFLEELLYRLGLPDLWSADPNHYAQGARRGSPVFRIAFCWEGLERAWWILSGTDIPGLKTLHQGVQLVVAGESVEPHADGLFAEADRLRLFHLGLANLEERLRYALTVRQPPSSKITQFGPEAINVLLRWRLTEPEVWTHERLQWPLYDLLERYPGARVEPELVLAASRAGLSYRLEEAAVVAARDDERILSALQERLDGGQFQAWELAAYARLADPSALALTLRPLWRSEVSDKVMKAVMERCPDVGRAMAEEMLDALEGAGLVLRERILRALPHCPLVASRTREIVCDMALRNWYLAGDALRVLKGLPDGPESLPLLLAQVSLTEPSSWALELLVRGGHAGPEVVRGLVAYLRHQTGMGEHERMALDSLTTQISASSGSADVAFLALQKCFRPTPALLELAALLRPRTLPLLVEALSCQDADVMEQILEAYQLFADQDAETVGAAAAAIQRSLDAEPEHRLTCYFKRVLGHLRPESIPFLTKELKSSFLSERVIERRRAASVFESWGSRASGARDVLESYLIEVGESDTQEHLRRAISYIKTP